MSGKGNCISNKSTPPATHYELTNHLGNVMAVISDEASTTAEPTVVSLSDYYPYGMTEPGRSWTFFVDPVYQINSENREDEISIENMQGDFDLNTIVGGGEISKGTEK